MQTRIKAILTNYDGTLSPTYTVRSKTDSIPEQLEGVLWKVSQRIPVCIISTKDYHFIHPRAKFARIFSCIMGIETIRHRSHEKAREIEKGMGEIGCGDNSSCIEERYLLPNCQKLLQSNSATLSKLAESIELEFKTNLIC
jgi:hypothetical protein